MLLKFLRSAFRRVAHSETLVNRSLALRQAGRLHEAEQMLRAAAVKFPEDAVVATNLGVVLLEQDRAEEGVGWLQRALVCDPHCAPAHFNLANILRGSGQREPAIEHYRAAIAADPAFGHAREELLNCLLEVCDWDCAERVADELHTTIEREPAAQWMPYVSPLTALHLGLAPAQVKAISAHHAAEFARGIAPLQRAGSDAAPAIENPARLRIGYLSRDLRDHAVGHLLANVFSLHDRVRFEIYAFSYGADDASGYRKTIATGVDHFIDGHAMTDDELAAAIAAAGIHVLVDLAGHTTGNRMRVLARRPAPVQAHYLGFAATTGAEYIDYFISDRIATPPSMVDAFSEKLAYAAHCFMLSDGTDAVHVVADAATVACPQFAPDAVVFCNFNNGSRITRDDFAAWMEILRGVPGSVLWLQGANTLAVANLRGVAGRCGVDAGRIIFAQRVPTKREHLARLHRADLMLDTISWHNAHSTASDALWAGVPLLTVPGRHFANRVAASLATAAGLAELVCPDRSDFIQTALRLGKDRNELAALKRQLLARAAPFFDTQMRMRDLEAAYLGMWKDHLDRARIVAG